MRPPRCARGTPQRLRHGASARLLPLPLSLPLSLLFSLLLSLPLSMLLVGATAAQELPSFEALRASHQPSDLALLDRHGQPLQMLRWDHRARRGPWTPLADVSPALREAIVLSEDRRFWDHGGVDWAALAASAWANAWNTRTRGASTLTMQLAGLLDAELARPAGGRSVGAKLSQMARARQLEAGWSKAQILEAYLNRVPLRGELVGVAAAAQQLFGRHPHALDRSEAALLAVMVRGPNADTPTLRRRACAVLREQRQGCETLAITLAQALARSPGPMPGEALAPHLARQVLTTTRGATPALAPALATTFAATANPPGSLGPPPLQTTLDARLQRFALAALRRQLAELRGHEVQDGAVLVLDNRSGEVLAWVGSAGAGSAAPQVDAVLARRQPGSTLKPLLYALALQQRLLTPASRIDDAPLQVNTGGALYRPQNHDHQYRGAVSLRTALASSLNVPAVRVAGLVGADALFHQLGEAGLAPRENAGYHGPALALGSADVTLLALSNAYRMLARGGELSAVRYLASTPPAQPSTTMPVFEPAVAWLVADMLADPAARAAGFGLDSPLVTRGWAAVKTGTSKDMRDNWSIGFTSRYTVGVWVGNASGAPMHGVSGVSGAAPVWREIVGWLHAQTPSLPPPRPPGLVQHQGEWFLHGTEPPAGFTQPMAAAAPAFGIRSPSDGSLIVLDPDIPMAAQRLVFEGAPGRWRLDGRMLGSGTVLHWLPRPGRHRLEWLAPGSDATADVVSFEVRAAPAAGRGRPGSARGAGRGAGTDGSGPPT